MRAMILSAGRGERLRPLTDHQPKPLLPLGGKPMMLRHLENFKQAGIQEIVINLGHLGEKIEQWFGNGAQFGLSIQYSYEDPILETGGGIAKALPYLGLDPFLAVSGDVVTDYPFERLVNFSPRGLAHLVLVDNPPHHLKGDYSILEDGTISETKPPFFNFAGIGVYRPQLFENCPEGAFPLPFLFKRAFLDNAITGEYYSGFWHNIGTFEQLQAIDQLLSHSNPSQDVSYDFQGSPPVLTFPRENS